MLKYSLTTSKDGRTIIKIHHEFGDFKFYLVPDEKDKNAFSWASFPQLPDTQAGDYIAREAAKSIATFAKSQSGKMSFDEMVACLKNAQRMEQ